MEFLFEKSFWSWFQIEDHGRGLDQSYQWMFPSITYFSRLVPAQIKMSHPVFSDSNDIRNRIITSKSVTWCILHLLSSVVFSIFLLKIYSFSVAAELLLSSCIQENFFLGNAPKSVSFSDILIHWRAYISFSSLLLSSHLYFQYQRWDIMWVSIKINTYYYWEYLYEHSNMFWIICTSLFYSSR